MFIRSYKIMRSVTNSGAYGELALLLMSVFIAYLCLHLTDKYIDLENLAKGDQNTTMVETIGGKPYTASTVAAIKQVIDDSKKSDDIKSTRIMWLGYSQLHYINQYHKGDHLSPFWLRRELGDAANVDVLGLSLANAGFQEYLFLSHYAVSRIPVHLFIIALCFDKMRMDDLRCEFLDMLTPEVEMEMRASSKTVESNLEQFHKYCAGEDSKKDNPDNSSQQLLERWLNNRLSTSWKLWADRHQIEGNIMISLNRFRNWALGIKPMTVRKMIPYRYTRNMGAMREMLEDMKRRGIKVLLYIAPIRQDKPIPYDLDEYSKWKKEMSIMAGIYDAQLVNFEQIVPGEYWGSYHGNDVDFMHFKGEGHIILANALLPYVNTMIINKSRR